jgi:hypothetical protein
MNLKPVYQMGLLQRLGAALILCLVIWAAIAYVIAGVPGT